MKEEILRMERVTCKNGERTELQDVSLSIPEGEIVGLVPVNTYGLESLLSVLLYNSPLYYGYVYYREKCINSWKSEKRGRNPISLIDGSRALVEGMSVGVNLYAFGSDRRNEILREQEIRDAITPYLEELAPERFGVSIPLEMPVEKLSPLQSTVAEIIRAVMLDRRLIILREISSVLSEEQVSVLSGIIRHYAARGYAFLYISMHLEEIRQVCTRAAIFTNGSIDMVADLGEEEKGGSLEQSSYRVYADGLYRSVSGAFTNKERTYPKEALMEICCESLPAGISVRRGECLAVQFLDTRPYLEMVRALADPENAGSARICLQGKRITKKELRRIAVLKENAAETMVFPEMSILDNLCISMDHRLPGIWRKKRLRCMIREEYIRLTGRDVFDRGITSLNREEKTEIVYMRVYMQRPEVLIIEQPFKGADVPMKQKVWELIGQLMSIGITVVLLTVNMADALALATRAIRVGPRGQTEEYLKESFGELPDNLPWAGVYRDLQREKGDGSFF